MQRMKSDNNVYCVEMQFAKSSKNVVKKLNVK